MENPKEIEVRSGPGGETAFIAGTRTRVSDIARVFSIMRDEVVIERICQALPHLQPEQVRAAVEWWRENSDLVDAEIAEERALLKKTPAG